MRLISQDGTYDFPYEHVVVYRNETSVVCGIMPDIREKVLLGKYSSKSKALKVMEMLREEYLKHIYGSGGEMATRDLYIPPFAFIPPKVFKFPADEEVEV